MRKGIVAGFSFNSLTLTGATANTSMGGGLSPLAGIFIDLPLGVRKADWMITVQAYYQEGGFQEANASTTGMQESVANIGTVNLPVSFKRTFRSVKKGKFISLGPSIGYNVKRENYTYSTTISGNVVTEQKTNLNSLNQLQLGLTCGVGMNFELQKGNVLDLELRYQFGKGIAVGETSYSMSSLQLAVSCSF